MYRNYNEEYLSHHGIKGMKWGVRRYQNADGTLTAAGKKREAKRYTKELNWINKTQADKYADVIRADRKYRKLSKDAVDYEKKYNSDPSRYNEKTLQRKIGKASKALDESISRVNEYGKVDSDWLSKTTEAANKGYTVQSKEFVRMTKVGEQLTTRALAGPIGTLSIQMIQSSRYGEKYKTVLKNGKTFNQTPWLVKSYKSKVTPNDK